MVIKLPLIFVLTSNKANRKDTAYRTFFTALLSGPGQLLVAVLLCGS